MTKRTFKKSCALFLSAILLVSGTAGCLRQPKLSVIGGYERFHASSITNDAQKQFDDLTDRIFAEEAASSQLDLHYALANPANYGIAGADSAFGEFSLEKIRQTFQDLKSLQSELKAFQRSVLREDQQLTYDILNSYIETELTSEGLELYSQPLTPTIGIQAQLPILLCEYAFYQKQDIEDYLNMLCQIDTYYGQILQFEQEKAKAGLFMSEDHLNLVLDSCRSYTNLPEDNFLSETFRERLAAIQDVTPEEAAQYTARNQAAIQEHFIPAYNNLIQGLEALRGSCTAAPNLCGLPEGKRYYEYLVASNTATSYPSISALSSQIKRQLLSDAKEISRILTENPSLMDQVDSYAFRLSDPKEILEDLKTQIRRDFPELPDYPYTVKYVPEALEESLSPAFYLTPPLDLADQNTIYINGNEKYEGSDLYTTLAHEGYPGHLYQCVYFNEHISCNLRSLLSFTSYSEGWATYVEHYAYTLDNGLDPSLGKLLAANSSSILAIHALLDININYYGWTKEQVADYLKQILSLDDPGLVDSIYSLVTSNPTNYLEYYLGYLEILDMRNEAEKALGTQFDLKKFHTFILDIGPAPFTVIRSHFKSWLKDQRG